MASIANRVPGRVKRMSGQLTERQEAILRSIIGSYVEQAVPVPSDTIARSYHPRVSPATVRHEMAFLEDEGYILRSHHSAGAQPVDKGYRYYVESLLEQEEVPADERLLLYHLFHQVAREMDEWMHLAAAMLARMAHNAALVTPPHDSPCRFKHMELVTLQDFLVMVILIIRHARVKHQLLPLRQAAGQAELSHLSEDLNRVYQGATRAEIERGLLPAPSGGPGGEDIPAAGKTAPGSLRDQVTGSVLSMMESEDMEREETWCLEGLHLMLEQPEFAQGEKARVVMEVVAERNVLRQSIREALKEQGVKVIIGAENEAERLRDYSLVLTRYGVPGEARGILGVLGPTRMRYGRAIATVNYLSGVLTRLLADLYGKRPYPS